MLQASIRYFSVIIFCLDTLFSVAQDRKIESLLYILKNDKPDTSKIKHLNELGQEFMNIDPDTAIVLCNEALALTKKIDWSTGRSTALNTMGMCHVMKGDYLVALENFSEALKIEEAANQEHGVARQLGNIGIVYYSLGDDIKALDYYLKSLKIEEKLGNRNKIAASLGNIGLVYYRQKEFDKALEFNSRSLHISEELLAEAEKKGDAEETRRYKRNIATQLANVALWYYERNQVDKALEFNERAYKLGIESGNKNEIGRYLGNFGIFYFEKKDYQKAKAFYNDALRTAEETGDKLGMTRNVENMGVVCSKTGQYKEAEDYYQKAIALATEIGARAEFLQIETNLAELYAIQGKHQLALEHYRKMMALKDSLFNGEKDKEITRKELNYEFEKKQAAEKAEHEKALALNEADKKRQALLLWFTAAGLFLCMVVVIIVFRSLRITRTQKAIIEEQKQLVEKQKILVEDKQKEILDSIYYAKRIQEALMPKDKQIARILDRRK